MTHLFLFRRIIYLFILRYGTAFISKRGPLMKGPFLETRFGLYPFQYHVMKCQYMCAYH